MRAGRAPQPDFRYASQAWRAEPTVYAFTGEGEYISDINWRKHPGSMQLLIWLVTIRVVSLKLSRSRCLNNDSGRTRNEYIEGGLLSPDPARGRDRRRNGLQSGNILRPRLPL